MNINNILKNSFHYSSNGRLYILVEELNFSLFEVQGEKLQSLLIEMIDSEKKSTQDVEDALFDIFTELNESLTYPILDGTIKVKSTQDTFDEFELKAYAKYPSSEPTCADGSYSSGPTLADDNACISYAIE